MSNERLGNLAVLAFQGFDIQLSVDKYVNHSHKNVIKRFVVIRFYMTTSISYNMEL